MESLKTTTLKLLEYCREKDWEGHDPYDALNSRFLGLLPFLNNRLTRIVITQVLRRMPFNIRPLLLIPPTQNPKALGLFLSAMVKLDRCDLLDQKDLVVHMIGRIEALRASDVPHYCWGYSFPWQTRTVIVPRGAPNLVCTTFVADSLLDAHEDGHGDKCLEMAFSAGDYILDELYWRDDQSAAGFSYPVPGLQTKVHNANFLASALLSRIYRLTGERKFVEPALTAARYAASKQNKDGSWYYGELPTQAWIDNFHTGYNLCSLRSIAVSLGTSEFDLNIKNGFTFYRDRFFRKDGAAGYFHDRIYPIDVHSIAQSIITLLKFEDIDPGSRRMAHKVFNWVMHNMWDGRGYFHYRASRFLKNRISYMRWSQAWMLLALAAMLESTVMTGEDFQRAINLEPAEVVN